jgi:hypothetical protein
MAPASVLQMAFQSRTATRVSVHPVAPFRRVSRKGTGAVSQLYRMAYVPKALIYQADWISFRGYRNESSVFMLDGNSISLSSPTLTFKDVTDKLWMHENTTYARDDMRGICQPGKTYQWGFSFYALLAFCITTTLYAVVMYSLWLRTYLDSRKHRAGHRLGLFRAAIDFADALKAGVGEDCTYKTEKQLKALVNSRELGISYKNVNELPPPRVRRRGKQQTSD